MMPEYERLPTPQPGPDGKISKAERLKKQKNDCRVVLKISPLK
jgi:hypothetical protein